MKTSAALTLVCLASTLVWGGVRAINYIKYDQQVGGFLKQAADANTTELAEKKLAQAIKGMDDMHICNSQSAEAPPVFSDDCYTSVIWRTPDEDIGFWRTNIQATYDDLRTMSPEDRADNLVESNTLIKVRETLLDQGQHVRVTAPEGISVYPNNKPLFWWGLFSLIGFMGAGFYWMVDS